MTEADAVETARLVHLLTWDDYDRETGKGQIMGTEPPKESYERYYTWVLRKLKRERWRANGN